MDHLRKQLDDENRIIKKQRHGFPFAISVQTNSYKLRASYALEYQIIFMQLSLIIIYIEQQLKDSACEIFCGLFRMEIEKCEKELEEGNRQLRRGRFTIIEEELSKYKYEIDKQTSDFVERNRIALEQEYNHKLRVALGDATHTTVNEAWCMISLLSS